MKMSIAMIEKYYKHWSDIQGLMALAVILDSRLKMIMLEACYIVLKMKLINMSKRAMSC